MSHAVVFSLTFSGKRTKQHEIDLYDVAHALIGFQRSIALTTHLIINDQVITQAPSLKGASIYAFPAEPGSWKIMAGVSIAATGLFHLGTAPRDTPIGHLVYSAYDYVVKESLGVHVDYTKSLGQQYEELKASGYNGPALPQHRFDAVIEKCENAIKQLHRPIVGDETAAQARISAFLGNRILPVGTTMNRSTFDYLFETVRDDRVAEFWGRVTSYNSNNFKGRVFVPMQGRPLPFELQESARSRSALKTITDSLSLNALYPKDRDAGYFKFRAHIKKSKTEIIKSLEIVSIADA